MVYRDMIYYISGVLHKKAIVVLQKINLEELVSFADLISV